MGKLDQFLEEDGALPGKAPAPTFRSEEPERIEPRGPARKLDRFADEDLTPPSAGASLALRTSLDRNPDQEGEFSRLGRQYGMPVAAVREYPEPFRVRAAMDEAIPALERSPRLASWVLGNPQRAALVHDDIGTLSEIERAVRSYGGAAVEGVVGQGAGFLLSGAGRLYDVATRALAAPIDIGLKAIGADAAREFLLKPREGISPSDLLKQPGAYLQGIGEAAGPKGEDRTFGTDVVSGLGQFGSQAAIYMLTGGSTALLSLFAQGAESVGKKTEQDDAPQHLKDLAILGGGVVTAATEKWALDKILGPLAAPLKKRMSQVLAQIGIGAAAEGGQEMAENILHDALRKALTNPEAEFSSLSEIAYEGGVGATVGGIASALVQAALHVRARGGGRQQQAALAEDIAARVEKLDELRTAAKLASRDSESFRELVAEIAEEDGDAPTEFYVDGEQFAQVLAQSGLSREELAAVAPVAVGQLEAAAVGSDIRIPVSEFLVAGDLMKPLIDHVKTAPKAMSRAQAREVLAKVTEQMDSELEAAATSVEEAETFRKSIAGLQASFETQLLAAGRPAQEAKLGALVLASAYGTQAARTGTTVAEKFSQYGVRIQQGSHSKVVDAQGKPLVVYHGTGQAMLGAARGTFDDSANILKQAAVPEITERDLVNSLEGARVSPRLPTAVKATEDPLGDTRLQPDLETAKRDPAAFAHNIGLMTKYENFRGLRGTADAKAEAIISHMVENLLWLHDQMPEAFRERTKMWYVGGNRIAHRWAERFGVPVELVAGVIAATSPKKDWFQNVSLAERILEAVVNRSEAVWDQKMSETVLWRDWGNKLSAELKFVPKDHLRRFEGKTLRDLYNPDDPASLMDMAVWIRAWDEANNPMMARVITPEGGFTNRFDIGKSGEEIGLRWQSFATMAKTLRVLMSRDLASISRVIGANHKVRSFYNNIIAPMAGEDVTIDTHAVAAALLRPIGSSSVEAGHNFGTNEKGKPGPANSSITGLYGTYAIYAEAYRRAAQARGVMPREMQSITWEAVRGLFRPEQKNATIKTETGRIWRRVAAGEIDANIAREQIKAMVGGVADPAWSGSPAGVDEARADSSYADELPLARAPGRGAGPGPSGGVGGPAGGTDGGLSGPAGTLAQSAYHGTHARGIEKFSTDFIGTGEGAQAYGWGLYFASRKEIAEFYRKMVAVNGRIGDVFMAGVDTAGYFPSYGPEDIALTYFALENGDRVGTERRLLERGEERALKWFRENVGDLEYRQKVGQLYKVDVPEDTELLDWDKPLSEQPEKVRDAVRSLGLEAEATANRYTGAGIYQSLAASLMQPGSSAYRGSADRAASEAMSGVGIRGIRYRDASSRGMAGGAILRINGEKIIPSLKTPVAQKDAHVRLFRNDGDLESAIAEAKAEASTPEELSYLISLRGSEITVSRPKIAHNFVIFSGDDVAITQQFYQQDRAQISLPASFDTGKAVIGLLQTADRSSFIHEAGHLFLEILADQAIKLRQQQAEGASISKTEQGIVDDVDTVLKWFGVNGSPELSALDTWAGMTLEEKRQHHEQFARGFEAYMREGKAPSIALQSAFQRFMAWLKDIYKKLTDLDVKLNDDIRGVMDRLLATDAAIADAQAQRNMGPLYRSADQAGMTLEWFEKYQALGLDATAMAELELGARSLRDMERTGKLWDRALTDRQKEVEAIRREMRIEVRAEVYSEPVYRAWQFLTAKALAGDSVARAEKKGKPVSLLEAIAAHGGLNRESAHKDLGVAADDLKRRVAGLQVPFAKTGGLDADRMAERLLEDGYLTPDENGKHSLHEFEDRLAAELRGDKQFAFDADFDPVSWLSSDVTHGKLNTSILKTMYGEAETAVWRKLSALHMTSEKGAHPDAVAQLFAPFDSGDALVRALAEAVPPEEVVEARTDERMLQEYGDITSQEALEQFADEAVHSEVRARFVALELAAARKAIGSEKVLREAAKSYAQRIIGAQRIRDLRPSVYAASAARHAKQAEDSLKADKIAEVGMHKRNQLVNLYAAKEAMGAKADVQAWIKYLRKFGKRIKGLDPDYQDQIDQLLEKYELKAISDRETDRRKSLAAWVESKQAKGELLDLSPELIENARKVAWRDLTVEEMRRLVDAVRQIEHLGRLKDKLLREGAKREFEALKDETAEKIRASRDKRVVPRAGPSEPRKRWEQFAAAQRKLSSYVHQMDGGEYGPLFDSVMAPANENSAVAEMRLRKFAADLDEVMTPVRDEHGGIDGDKRKIDALGESFTRFERMAWLLNWGNEQGRNRLSEADGMTQEGIAEIAKSLSPADLKAVNDLWKLIGQFWPEISAQGKKFDGVEPEKVKAVPFVVTANDGTVVQMDGGYYPLKYLADLDTSPPAKSEEDVASKLAAHMERVGKGMRATTARGHMEKRQESLDKKVTLDFRVIGRHAQEVIHNLTWREWVHDTHKLLTHPDVSGAIIEHYGRAVYDSMLDTVHDVALGDKRVQDVLERVLLWMRSNTTRAMLGFSVTTALVQPLGILQSGVRTGWGTMLRGVALAGTSAVELENAAEKIAGMSVVMKERFETGSFTREMREMSGTPRAKARILFDEAAFYAMRKLQQVVDIATWLGQYEKTTNELTKPGADPELIHEQAVAQADRVVIEGQGAGANVHLSAFQRNHPLWTMFMSYFSATYQLMVESTQKTDFKNAAQFAKWSGDMLALSVVPALGLLLMKEAFGVGGDDDDKGFVLKAGQEFVAYMMSMVPLVRELSGVSKGYEYNGPPFLRPLHELGRVPFVTYRAWESGEWDKAAQQWGKALGYFMGLPVVQANRVWEGWKAWQEGEAGPSAMLFGPPPKR